MRTKTNLVSIYFSLRDDTSLLKDVLTLPVVTYQRTDIIASNDNHRSCARGLIYAVSVYCGLPSILFSDTVSTMPSSNATAE